ncbi:uncharacterized protein MYCFIDRAFT_209866 [Pseudocercospora fijiensis CIRAD86]|uniref:Uncharacterized protein n=1 Tax=Pseudocercospora fijiensis (strain CIRAD86) TaxID=383855 RepID=N1Q7J5_PSEFD|nr:uncharacterized protein MYCFIDRAFT_209866 [Pseudocercospora fijiensis CIRAD86]EME88644.1 hypothetical protein MYCFIDRAFT_209866 [Pseudocercospora fijiensis CIRAD86]
MHFASSYALIATAYWTISARALPYANHAPTYSVVDVGGPSSTDDASTIYETVQISQSAYTVTQPAPAATVTTIPEGPIVPHVEPSTHVYPMTTTMELSMTIPVAAPTPTSASTSSSTSTSASSCTSTSTTPVTVPFVTPSPVAYTAPASTWSSSSSSVLAPSGTSSYTSLSTYAPSYAPQASGGFAKPSGWAAPWNSTNGYVPQGYASPSGVMPFRYAPRATPSPPTIAYVS